MNVSSILMSALLIIAACWTGASADCVYRGVTYPEGPVVTGNPCDHCVCTESGKAECAIIDCFYPVFNQYCADGSLPVDKDGLCCPVCNSTSTTEGERK